MAVKADTGHASWRNGRIRPCSGFDVDSPQVVFGTLSDDVFTLCEAQIQ